MAKKGRPPKVESEPSRIRQEFYLDPEQVEYLEAIATSTSHSKAEVVRNALYDYMKKYPLIKIKDTKKE